MFERNDLEALKKDIKVSAKEMAKARAEVGKEKCRSGCCNFSTFLHAAHTPQLSTSEGFSQKRY